ncbi:MAG: hypothetical protein HC803_06010 [Saprospiraceae bacterium]|nr:hypothetical protein [Saprospiraceae bacterium]
MQPLFDVEIKERFERLVNVEAYDLEDAIKKVKQYYDAELIVLTADDYVDTIIEPYLYSSDYKALIADEAFKAFVIKKRKKNFKYF